MEQPGLQLMREVKAFRGRDDLKFGLPHMPCVIVIAMTAMLWMYYGAWLGAVVFFVVCTTTGKLLARHDPYFLEIFPQFCRMPKVLCP